MRKWFKDWQKLNPVLAVGEVGEIIGMLDTKTGDGKTPWRELSFTSPVVSSEPSEASVSVVPRFIGTSPTDSSFSYYGGEVHVVGGTVIPNDWQLLPRDTSLSFSDMEVAPRVVNEGAVPDGYYVAAWSENNNPPALPTGWTWVVGAPGQDDQQVEIGGNFGAFIDADGTINHHQKFDFGNNDFEFVTTNGQNVVFSKGLYYVVVEVYSFDPLPNRFKFMEISLYGASSLRPWPGHLTEGSERKQVAQAGMLLVGDEGITCTLDESALATDQEAFDSPYRIYAKIHVTKMG